ncbi:MAG: tetratricopeptide repeat protein [Deltaproteobacteria bacterium]|nr:tetratricopeptide repeat protein [Deltaproteobacteria bacterium]
MKKKDLALDLLEMALAKKDEPVALATALIALDRLTQTRPEHALAHYAAGRVLMLMRQHQLAMGAFRIASQHDPALVDAYYYEGVCHHALGFDDLALDRVIHARTLDPTHFLAWYDEGQLLFERGEDRGSYIAFERARALRPDDFGATKKCLQQAIRLGRWEVANTLHERLREIWRTSDEPEVRGARSVVIDQFEVGRHDVLAVETLAPAGDPEVLMTFVVTLGGKIHFTVNLESSAVLRLGGHRAILAVQGPGGRITTEFRYASRPGYHLLRPDVEALVKRLVKVRAIEEPT